MDVGARLVGLLERAPAAMASAAAALAARVLNRVETKTPPWPEALREESPPALPTQVHKRCQAALHFSAVVAWQEQGSLAACEAHWVAKFRREKLLLWLTGHFSDGRTGYERHVQGVCGAKCSMGKRSQGVQLAPYCVSPFI